ncbi:MAG TPA: hypothetical protein VIV83_10965 [Gemmatimonadales bacterium]|jgi:hypothetical protein
MSRQFLRLPVIALLLALASTPAAGQTLNAGPRFGGHVGYISGDDWLAGPQLFWPISSVVDLYPSFDYIFVPSGSAWAMNLDLKAVAPARDVSWFLGGGLGYYRSSVGGGNFSSKGVNLFTGLEGRTGHTLPYVEVRWMIGEGRAFRVGGGINWR